MKIRSKAQVFKTFVPYALIVTLIVATGCLFYQNKQLQRDIAQNNPQTTAEVERVLSKLSNILLFEDDSQTVARVDDIAQPKRENPEFYKNVEEGDYVIVFPEKAVIYRETENKIINVAVLAPEPDEDNRE